MNLETNKALFIAILIMFSTAIVFMGAYDLKRRYSVYGSSEVNGYKMVQTLYGEVDLAQRAEERRLSKMQAIKERNRNWDGFKKFFASFIP